MINNPFIQFHMPAGLLVKRSFDALYITHAGSKGSFTDRFRVDVFIASRVSKIGRTL